MSILPHKYRAHIQPGSLLACILLAAFVSACDHSRTVDALEDDRDTGRPDQESWDILYSITEDGNARMTVEALYHARIEDADSVYTLLEGGPEEANNQVVVYLYDDGGERSAVLTADKVYYFEGEKMLDARGKVLVVSESDRRLQSEHLRWHEEDRKIRTPGFVRIETPSEQIQGYRLEADENLDNYVLARVTGQVEIEEEDR